MTTKIDAYFDMIPNLNISAEWFNYNNDTFNNVGHDQPLQYRRLVRFRNLQDQPGQIRHLRPVRQLSAELHVVRARIMSLIILGLDWFAWGANGRLPA